MAVTYSRVAWCGGIAYLTPYLENPLGEKGVCGIQWECEQRRYEFDFMCGDEEYKYRFGGVNRFVMRARVANVFRPE